MRNGTTNDSSFNKQDNLLLSQTAEEKGTMSSTSNYDDDSVNESPRNGRCRRRPDGLSKALNVSLKPARNGVQYYGQQLPHQNARPASNEGQYYGQHSAFDNSIMSMDWGSNDGEASTSERGRKVINHNESLVFDDDISLSLHKVFVDDDSTDRNDSVEKRTLLQESAYQLSTVCEAVDGIVAQLDTSIGTTRQTDTSIRTSSLKTSSSKSTSSSSFYTDKSQDEVYENKVGIWGREKELQILQSRYVSTTAGMSRQKYVDHVKPRHVWISGVSGIGKTSLVDAYLRQVGTKPIICRGAFEENWMNDSKPFPGLVSCFTDLFQDFLDDSHAQEWAKDIRSRLDKIDVTLLVSLIPSLAVLLDVDADDTKYSFETTDRFLFGRLSRALGRILVLTCEFTPVIFSLDDVQWAGDDALELLKTLLLTDELQNFFFIGSHRSGINVSHSLHKIKAEVAGLFGDDIKLGGIGRNPAKLLVRSHLRHLHNEYAIDSGMLDSLMKLWYSHSNSRIPIFIEHLVLLLYEKNAFIVEDGKWILDSPKILPSSSLSLLVERIESLPIEFDVVLQSAALLDVADFNTDILLVAINAIPKSQEVEIDIDKVEDILLVLCEKMFIEEHSAGRYSFAHNVIKVAAASRIPISTKRKRSSIHWRLATNLKRLKDDTPAMQSESKNVLSSLLIANHLNKGLLSVEDRAKTEMVVKLYVQLAEAAMKRSAFVTARNILETGVAALDKKSKWEESYVLTLKTHLNLARCLFCADELDKAKSIVNTIIANGNHPRDTIEAFDLLISIYRSKMQYEQSKQFALKALNDIWDDDISNSNVEEKFSKIRELVQKKSDADLLVLPDLDHKKISKKMPFLLQLAEISGLCRDYKLQDLAALRMVELTLKYGSYEVNFTGLAFALFGLCVARRHLHGEAYRYGRLAEMMTEKDTPLGRQAIVHHNYHMRHWRNHMRGSRKPLKEICQASIDGNDNENLSFQVGAYISAMLYTGTPFNCQDSIIELYNEKRKHFELAENWNVIAPYNALVKLKGETSRLIKRKYSDEKGVQYDLFFQMVVSVFMNDMEKAENLNSKIFMKPAGCWGSYRAFMEGLIATHYAQSSRKNNFLYQKKASKFIEILTTYTKTGMNNSAHMANILNVELMIASDKSVTSKRLSILFDTAISSAYRDGFPHHAALASERAGTYFLRIHEENFASKYLSRALMLYSDWGAFEKVEQLESFYGNYLDTNHTQMRNFKESNSIPSGTLMFTDRNSEQGSVRASRRASIGSKIQDDQGSVRASRIDSIGSRSQDDQGSVRASRRASIGSRPQDDHISPNSTQKSLSSDSRVTLILKRKKNGSLIVEGASTHSRGRPVLSKAVKEVEKPRSRSLTHGLRASFVRAGSLDSIRSNMTDDKSNGTQDTKKKKSSKINGGKAKEGKGKFFRRKSDSPKPTGKTQRKSDGMDAEEKTLSPAPAKKRMSNVPIPSPKPNKSIVVDDDDWSNRSYLLNYDTDDFDTLDGDTHSGSSLESKPEKPEEKANRQMPEKPTEKKGRSKSVGSNGEKGKKDKSKKKATKKKKKKKSGDEESNDVTSDVFERPKRRSSLVNESSDITSTVSERPKRRGSLLKSKTLTL